MKKCWILALSVVLVATSCSPFQVQTDYSKSVNFVGYKTYQLSVKNLELNDIDKDRVLGSVFTQLTPQTHFFWLHIYFYYLKTRLNSFPQY